VPTSTRCRDFAFRLTATILGLGVITMPAGCAEADQPAETDSGFSIMTWNLEWFYDEITGDNYSRLAREQSAPDRERWNWRRDAVASSIVEVRPTVVAVQEIESRRILWYLGRALARNHDAEYDEYAIQGRDHYTEQDVGLLVRDPAAVLSTTHCYLPDSLRDSDDFHSVSKHLRAVVQVPVGDRTERVIVVTVHFRARAEAEPERTRQARSVHRWVRDAIAAGEHVVVLGDTNSEQTVEGAGERGPKPGSDLYVLSGRETESPEDDLVDLHTRIPSGQRRTHLLPGKQYDRILVTRSLLEDDPSRLDLAFEGVTVREDLAIRGQRDQPEAHWERYWKLSADERDLSDHYPVVARFTVR